MDLQKWWKDEGSVMHERGCSIDVIANAAWNAATLSERKGCAEFVRKQAATPREKMLLDTIADALAGTL